MLFIWGDQEGLLKLPWRQEEGGVCGRRAAGGPGREAGHAALGLLLDALQKPPEALSWAVTWGGGSLCEWPPDVQGGGGQRGRQLCRGGRVLSGHGGL